MIRINGHEGDNPESLVNFLDAQMEATQTRCKTCRVRVEIIPAAGTRSVLGITHERHCPDWVDDE